MLARIVSSTLSAIVLCAASTAWASIFTVTTTVDNATSPPTGSLRGAILHANAHPGFDNINFNIPGAGIHTITWFGSSFADEFYVIDPGLIDATTQPGYNGSPLIELNCNGSNQAFFLTGDGGITIRGFIINRFASNGITIWPGSNRNSILDNWIGLDQTGNGIFPDPNLARGIGVHSSSNLIQGNTIDGVDNGVIIGFSSIPDFRCTSNIITNNRIGTDPTGMVRVGITGDGVFLFGGAAFNTIGPNNVISGVGSSGCELFDPTSQYNTVVGNIFGLDATGTQPIPNHDSGLLISNGSMYNYVAQNTISNGGIAGIIIGTANAFESGIGNLIEHNRIGTDVTGTIPMPNQQLVGIHIGTNRSYWNTIRYNVVVANTRWGIYLENALNNLVQGNKVGVMENGMQAGNGADGIYLQGASWNTILSNDVEFNGFEDTSWDGWMGIRLDGGSFNNVVTDNFVAHNLHDQRPRPDIDSLSPRSNLRFHGDTQASACTD